MIGIIGWCNANPNHVAMIRIRYHSMITPRTPQKTFFFIVDSPCAIFFYSTKVVYFYKFGLSFYSFDNVKKVSVCLYQISYHSKNLWGDRKLNCPSLLNFKEGGSGLY